MESCNLTFKNNFINISNKINGLIGFTVFQVLNYLIFWKSYHKLKIMIVIE